MTSISSTTEAANTDRYDFQRRNTCRPATKNSLRAAFRMPFIPIPPFRSIPSLRPSVRILSESLRYRFPQQSPRREDRSEDRGKGADQLRNQGAE